MNQLFSVKDILTSGYTVEFLGILSVIALLFSIAVIINKNPITSLLSLIGLFGSISVYLILSGLSFIGFSYLIVVRFCASRRYGSLWTCPVRKSVPSCELRCKGKPYVEHSMFAEGGISPNKDGRIAPRADSPKVKTILFESQP